MRRIKWTGPKVVRRIVGPYIWSSETSYIQDVTDEDEDLALELLTAPGDHFEEIEVEAKVSVVVTKARGTRRKRGKTFEESE